MADEQKIIVSTKNTKQQILDAYEDVCKRLEQQQTINPQKEEKKKRDAEIVKRATSESTASIIQGVADLKVQINQSLNKLGESLTNEFNKLEDITEAVKLEQQHLEELYQIKETTNSLSALICTQDEMKREFERKVQERRAELEKEGTERREYWKEEQNKLEAKFKERKENFEKTCQREEEEYKYNLLQSRQKEEDAAANEKIAKEKELLEREQEIASKEQQFDELKQKVEQFDDRLNASIESAKEALNHELTSKHEFATKLFEKEVEGKMSLKDQRIAALEAQISKQESMIKQLNEKSNLASQQVQDIATRALDTSGQRIVNYPTKEAANRDDKQSA